MVLHRCRSIRFIFYLRSHKYSVAPIKFQDLLVKTLKNIPIGERVCHQRRSNTLVALFFLLNVIRHVRLCSFAPFPEIERVEGAKLTGLACRLAFVPRGTRRDAQSVPR